MTTAEVTLSGESEPGARLTVNGGYVPVGDNGAFVHRARRSCRGPQHSRGGGRRQRRAITPNAAAASSTAPAARSRSRSTRRLPRDAEGRLLTPGRRDRRRWQHRRHRRRPRCACSGPHGAPVVEPLVAENGAFQFTAPGDRGRRRLWRRGAGAGRRGRGDEATFAGSAEGCRPGRRCSSTRRRRPPPPTPGWSSAAERATRSRSASAAATARLAEGRFDAVATLVPGPNTIEIVAEDAVGNVAVKRIETVYDVDPPELLARGGRPASGCRRADRNSGRGARRLGPAPGRAVRC